MDLPPRLCRGEALTICRTDRPVTDPGDRISGGSNAKALPRSAPFQES